MKILNILFLFCSIHLFSQFSNTNDLRKEIYELILVDINKNKPNYPIKQIYIDGTVNKFKNIDLLSFDILFSDPEYVNDKEFCQLFFNVSCVEKFEIDSYKLSKVYNEHKDEDYPDFYGIYAPTDHWFQLVNQIVSNSLEKGAKTKAEIIIPVKNTYFKNGKVSSETLIYKFLIDENFKIIKSQWIKV